MDKGKSALIELLDTLEENIINKMRECEELSYYPDGRETGIIVLKDEFLKMKTIIILHSKKKNKQVPYKTHKIAKRRII